MNNEEKILAEYKLAYCNLFLAWLESMEFDISDLKSMVVERERKLVLNDAIFQVYAKESEHCNVMEHIINLELVVLHNKLLMIEAAEEKGDRYEVR